MLLRNGGMRSWNRRLPGVRSMIGWWSCWSVLRMPLLISIRLLLRDDDSPIRRSLVYPIRTNETLCSTGLSFTACNFPARTQVEVSEVGIISFRLNADRAPPWTTNIQPKSVTMEIDVIGGPGSLISSRMAICQQDPNTS